MKRKKTLSDQNMSYFNRTTNYLINLRIYNILKGVRMRT